MPEGVRSTALGVFDHFPEVDEGSSFDSPLTELVASVRRKNMIAAASSGSPDVAIDSSDPWDSLGGHVQRDTLSSLCNCRQLTRRLSIPHSSPVKKLKSPTVSLTKASCPACGRKKVGTFDGDSGFPWKGTSANPEKISAETLHVEELLLSTPQLRTLCPESTDMSGILPKSLNIVDLVTKPDTKKAVQDRGLNEYRDTLKRNAVNDRVAAELVSLMWTLAHEMSLEEYGFVENSVFTSVFALVHSSENPLRMAGLAALDALLGAPSADNERKTIKFANTLSSSLRVANGDFEFTSVVTRALGHMASKVSNVDFVESEVSRALEWLRTERSDRRLAACLALREFALRAPTTFLSKTTQSTMGQGGSNIFLDHVFQAVRDSQPVVRACAADALSQCLKILVERQHISLTGLLCQVHFALMDGLNEDSSKKRAWTAVAKSEAAQHGSLLVVRTMLDRSGDFMLPRFEEVCDAVLGFATSSKALIRLEVVRLIPQLARRCPDVFGRSYLQTSLEFLLESAALPTSQKRVTINIRPSVYTAIGHLVCSLVDEKTGVVIGGTELGSVKILPDPCNPTVRTVELCEKGIIFESLDEVFGLVRLALQVGRRTLSPALHCAANLIEALGEVAKPYIPDLIDNMFRSGLSNDLIECLHLIAECVPEQKGRIEDRMLQEVSLTLAGIKKVYDDNDVYGPSALRARATRSVQERSRIRRVRVFVEGPDDGTEKRKIRVDLREDKISVESLVLCFQTLTSFAGTVDNARPSGGELPLLHFLHDVVSGYLVHPSSEVRRAAALSCCMLLVPCDAVAPQAVLGSSGLVVESVLERILELASSDPSAIIRLCVVKALDSRYDVFLSQMHHLNKLFLTLQDEVLDIRAEGLKLLGRLAILNPAPVLPTLRSFLTDLIVELQCNIATSRGREEATRLLVVFLRCKPVQRLIIPVLRALLDELPLSKSAPPRLAAAALEALGDLADAAGADLQPWVKQLLPHVLEVMSDQSSTSKQRTSLRTLGQIAGSTGYVIAPYSDYPSLLGQITDILPATKRAPGALRREVIRTLGILGALDPAMAPIAQKGGVIGGAYFEEIALPSNLTDPDGRVSKEASEKRERKQDTDNLPAYLSMYEQYTMVAQPISSLPPARRITPKDVDFYPTVALQALMRVFRDSSLSVHHATVIQAIMFIFNSLGVHCVPYLGKVVPHVLSRLGDCSTSLRETLLVQLSGLSLLVREHLRGYVSDIFNVVEQFWNSKHLATIFGLLSNVATGLPDDFRVFVPRLVRRILESLDALQVADWTSQGPVETTRDDSDKLGQILRSTASLGDVLVDYLHVLVPALLKLANSLVSFESRCSMQMKYSLRESSILCCRTVTSLLDGCIPKVDSLVWPVYGDKIGYSQVNDFGSNNWFPARAVHPLLRILNRDPVISHDLGLAIIETLCVCAKLLGSSNWVKFDHVTRTAICHWRDATLVSYGSPDFASNSAGSVDCLGLYDDFIQELVAPSCSLGVGAHLGSERQPSLVGFDIVPSSRDLTRNVTSELQLEGYEQTVPSTPRGSNLATKRLQVSQRNLQRSWDVSQRSSREDWDEWMRRFAIQLLREAPDSSLRAAANLAQAHQPLARELFSASFACCWKELSDAYRLHLVGALETAFVADVSPEILLVLLNLAEFMEHDPSGGLPIDISILADLAIKCRAYAKALHYKEREYAQGRSNSCVEALISINRKLDLQEAALGTLKASLSRDEIQDTAEETVTRFSRHQGHDMFYSVVWDTDRVPGDDSGSHLGPSDKEGLWLSKLGEWTEALEVYKERLQSDPQDTEAMLGCMHCHNATGEWREVLDLASNNWMDLIESEDEQSTKSRRKALRMCAQASWRLGRWDELETYSSRLSYKNTLSSKQANERNTGLGFDGAFYSSVLHIHRKQWVPAAEAIDAARNAMDGRLTALLAESYSRAYPSMVTAQMLAEMEEIIEFRRTEERAGLGAHKHAINKPDVESARSNLLSCWKERLAGCRLDSETHSSILAVRSLVLSSEDHIESILTLSKLSRQAGRLKFSERVLLDPLQALGADLNGRVFGLNLPNSLEMRLDFVKFDATMQKTMINRIVSGNAGNTAPNYGTAHEQLSRKLVESSGGLERLATHHTLYFAYLRHLWFTGKKTNAIHRLEHLCDIVEMIARCERGAPAPLRVACWVELGKWKLEGTSSRSAIADDFVKLDVLMAFKRAILLENCGYKAWHSWALLNFRIANQASEQERSAEIGTRSAPLAESATERVTRNHIVAAVSGFVHAIGLGTTKESASVQQDLLNLLTCLFKFGGLHDVAHIFDEAVDSIEIEAWLGVLPQLLARIHIKEPVIRSVLHKILDRLGKKHPQALMYPLSVLLKSPVTERKKAAELLMSSLKNSPTNLNLVDEAQMVSSELIRVAILWLETWHEGLENACNLCFSGQNTTAMLDILLPLHEELEKGAESALEREFTKSFGNELGHAHSLLKEYIRRTGIDPTGKQPAPVNPPSEGAETIMGKTWDIYYSVFRNINKKLPTTTKLDLPMCSPSLSRARNLELGVPGSYRVDGSYVKIERFVPSVQIIISKQRPRKVTLRGSDGKDYMFLLKGHEDLRQDERVMQLFGLVNALLVRDPQTKDQDLMIKRYTISPLSHNCGVVGWVPHCDTLHALIRDYRQKVPLNLENREMLRQAPDYDLLTVMQKVEVFTESLKRVPGNGNDLGEIFWLKSTNSEEWLERRTKYTRSLAVMSIVGYILGLGDRHPSNLMIDKLSGRVLHIDFGDCFEIAMVRDKYPEKVPFRLTRMLIRAMEVSGIEGSYRGTCERTMSVLRSNRDSLVAMLEAFVHDPLISWRLVDLSHVVNSRPSTEYPGLHNAANETEGDNVDKGVPIAAVEPHRDDGTSTRHQAIQESNNEDIDEATDDRDTIASVSSGQSITRQDSAEIAGYNSPSSSRMRSLQMLSEMQSMAAERRADSRIASITAGIAESAGQQEASMARSRIERSMRQQQLLKALSGKEGAARESTLNRKALKVIHRVQDKLNGTDFADCEDEALDVPDQVQRLIVQATSAENLCQLFIGWCAFW